MKKFITVLVLIFLMNCAEGQISSIKKNLKELYYEISFPTTKYDLRKMINSSDNFSNISENNLESKYDIIHANLTTNYKLSYISRAKVRQLDFWFYQGTDKNYCAGLEFQYSQENVEEATKQYNELVSFFKGYSFKSDQDPVIVNELKVGDSYYFYSSSNSFQNNEPYLIVSMRFVELKDRKYYSISAGYYINNFYQ